MSVGTAVRAALAAAALFFGGVFGTSAGAQTLMPDGTTVCTFGNPASSDSTTKGWTSGQDWFKAAGRCYDRRLGVGLQTNAGVMATVFDNSPQRLAWVEVMAWVTASVKPGRPENMTVTLYDDAEGAVPLLSETVSFMFDANDTSDTVRLVLEEPMTCGRMALGSATGTVVLTVSQVRWGGTAEAVKVTPSLPQAVMPGQTFTVAVSCTGGTGTYTALGWSLEGTEGTVDLEGGAFAVGETVSFSVTAPAQPGDAELTVTVTDTAGAVGRAAVGLTVVNAATVDDLTLTELSVTGLTAAWTPPVPAPERIRVLLSRTESEASVAVPAGASADLALWTHTGGRGGWLIPQGALAEATFAYAFNGGATKTVTPGMWIRVPAGYPQDLHLSGLPETGSERMLKLDFDSLSQEADPGSGTCAFSGVALAGRSVTVSLQTCYDGLWRVAAQVTAKVPPLAPPAAVTARDDGSGGRIVEASPEAGGLYGIVCDVLLERMGEPGDGPTGLLLTRSLRVKATDLDCRAVVLTNASDAELSLAGYTLHGISTEGTSAYSLDLGLLEPNVLPPYGELYVSYRPSGESDRILFPGGAMPDAPVFGSGNYALWYYGASRELVLTGPDGRELSRVPPASDATQTLLADGSGYVRTSCGGVMPESFFEPWAGLPAWTAERAASQIGNGQVSFTAAEVGEWLRSPGLDRIRAEVRTYEPSLKQTSGASRSVLLWPLETPEPDPEAVPKPGYRLRLR